MMLDSTPKSVDRASARQAAQQLLQRGVGAVAVQAGDEGNFLVWSQGEYWLPKLPVNSIDATGAGDAFAAAMAVALAEDKSLIEAGSFAVQQQRSLQRVWGPNGSSSTR